MCMIAVVLEVLLNREQRSIALAWSPLERCVHLFRGRRDRASITVRVAARRRNVTVVGAVGVPHVGFEVKGV